MQSNLKTAILEFLANEFKLEPANISADLTFSSDFLLSPEEITGLLNRLQEALDFTLPEDKIMHINTVEDLLRVADPDSDTETVS